MRILNVIVLLAIAVAPVLFAVAGYRAAGGLLLIALIVVLLATNVSADRIEELTLGPLRAKLREKISEVNQLSSQLKDALKLMLTLAVTSGMRTGRFAHEQGRLHKQVFEQVKAIADNAKFESTELDDILSDFFKYVEVDMCQLIIGSRAFGDPQSEEMRKKIKDRENTSFEERLTLMRSLAEREDADKNELEEWLKDYAELTERRRLRRPEVWWTHDERAHGDYVIKHKRR